MALVGSFKNLQNYNAKQLNPYLHHVDGRGKLFSLKFDHQSNSGRLLRLDSKRLLEGLKPQQTLFRRDARNAQRTRLCGSRAAGLQDRTLDHEQTSLLARSVRQDDKSNGEGVLVLVLGSGGGNILSVMGMGVGLVVVGPEGPLVAGVVDDLLEAGIPTFGPSADAAALEGSKSFMKRICDKYAIPTAKYGSFSDAKEAKDYIQQQELPIVVKADGLAAGKGVIIAHTVEEAFQAVDSMLVDGTFGSAGGVVVVEEFLEGEEVSFFAIVDGETAIPLASAQDHKRVGDGDVGPNTGGMGAYSPAPILTPELQEIVMNSIILPTVNGMSTEGCKFVGVLYAGLIVETKTGSPKLLEYNVRFGDPECQVLMMRLRSDLVQLLLAACQGQLRGMELKWADEPALVVVVASQGYPGDYEKGTVISNLEEADSYGSKVKLFHAGTALNSEQKVIAVGGRVLGVTATGKDIVAAQELAYQVVDSINWPEGFCRRDIGWRAVALLNSGLEEKNQRHFDVRVS